MVSIRGEKRIDLGKSTIARLEKGNKMFEIIVDPKMAWDFKRGKQVDVRDVLVGFLIFEDARKGMKADEDDLKEVFGTDDVFKVAETILKEGELQLTSEQRKMMIDERLSKIIEIISKNCINPQTGRPHPPERIRKAIEEVKVSIDIYKPAEEQVNDVVDAISRIIPIKMEIIKMEVVIPAEFTGKGYGIVARMANIQEDTWLPNGSWKVILELPAGLYELFLNRINSLTKGKAMIKVIERK
ncbi:MAG: ribosome assembly factor SBDS [Candidatus Asgardarchaeia archaeon]